MQVEMHHQSFCVAFRSLDEELDGQLDASGNHHPPDVLRGRFAASPAYSPRVCFLPFLRRRDAAASTIAAALILAAAASVPMRASVRRFALFLVSVRCRVSTWERSPKSEK